jgi:hypothetical protein
MLATRTHPQPPPAQAVAPAPRPTAQPRPPHGNASPATRRLEPARDDLLARQLARVVARRQLQRVIDASTGAAMKTLAEEVDLDQDLAEAKALADRLHLALIAYLKIPLQQRQDIAHVVEVVELRDAAAAANHLVTQMRERRADATTTTTLGRLRRLTTQIGNDVNKDATALLVQAKGQRYDAQTEPATMQALETGATRHLLISPRPGTREAEGAGVQYPQTISSQDEMTLALPPKSSFSGLLPFERLKATTPPELEVLVVGGGHGGIGALFDQEGIGAFKADFWTNRVVAPMVAQGVRAKLIVLDACMTTSMIDVFLPLLTPAGQIVANMYTINARVMSPERWEQVLKAKPGTDEVKSLVMAGARDVATGAPLHAGETVAGLIRALPGDDVPDQLIKTPEATPFVSSVRYLTRICDALLGIAAAKNNLRVAECVGDLNNLYSATPAIDAPERQLLDKVLDALSRSAAGEAVDAVVKRLQTASGSASSDLAELRQAFIEKVGRDLAATAIGNVPSQIAIYDNAARTLRHDVLFHDLPARKRLEASTGFETRNELLSMDLSVALLSVLKNVTIERVDAPAIV